MYSWSGAQSHAWPWNVLSADRCAMCSNRAAAFLALGLWQEALADAERARTLAQAALKRSPKTAAPAYVKAFMQKGAALMGSLQQLTPFVELYY